MFRKHSKRHSYRPVSTMFKWLAEYERILVSGPQRSGTRICAKMIAHDTGHRFVDENAIYWDSLMQLTRIFHTTRRFVLQCPTMCRHVHMFSADDTAIVLMRRDVADIVASQDRIGWKWDEMELGRYDEEDGAISEVKYAFWDEHQRAKIKHAFEVSYDDLASHELWIEKADRKGFRSTQTKVASGSGPAPAADSPSELTVEAAQRAFESGDLRRAESIAMGQIGVNPKHAEAYHLMAHIHFRNGKIAPAVHSAQAAANLRPDSQDYLVTLAWTLHEAGALPQAEALYREILKRDPECAAAWYNMGNVLNATRRGPEAIACYERCLSIEPTHQEAARKLGRPV